MLVFKLSKLAYKFSVFSIPQLSTKELSQLLETKEYVGCNLSNVYMILKEYGKLNYSKVILRKAHIGKTDFRFANLARATLIDTGKGSANFRGTDFHRAI